MAALEKRVTTQNRNGIQQRAERQQRVVAVLRATQPAQMLLHLRREERTLHRQMLQADKEADTQTLCSLVSAAATTRNQILDLISWPKRPASAAHKPGSRPLIPVDAMPLDVQDVIRQEDSQSQDPDAQQ